MLLSRNVKLLALSGALAVLAGCTTTGVPSATPFAKPAAQDRIRAAGHWQVVAQDACRQAMGHGLREVQVRVKGPGMGREAAIRAMQAIGLEVTAIIDVTPVPHNGCRPRKQRRV